MIKSTIFRGGAFLVIGGEDLIDQVFIGSTGSYYEFDATVAERKDVKPKKKSIKETVPFSNVTHDFSAINGEVYWEERSLEYVFELMADTVEELEEKKQRFVSWIMNVFQEELHDPYIKGYHFIATFEDIDIDDSEVEKSTITVAFSAYPYMLSDEKRFFATGIGETETTLVVENNSSHRVTPTFKSDVDFTMKMGNSSFGIPAGETTDSKFMFAPGKTTIYLRAIPKEGETVSGTLKIEFYEEVF